MATDTQAVADAIIKRLDGLTNGNPNSDVGREEFQKELDLPSAAFERAVRLLDQDGLVKNRPHTLSITVRGSRYAESLQPSGAEEVGVVDTAEVLSRLEQELGQLEQILATAKRDGDFDAAWSRLDRWKDRVANVVREVNVRDAEKFSEISGVAVMADDWGNLEREAKAKKAFLVAMKEDLERAPPPAVSSKPSGVSPDRTTVDDDVARSLDAAGWLLGQEPILGEGGSGKVLRCYSTPAVEALEQGGSSPRAGALAVLGRVGDAVYRGEPVAAAVKISTQTDLRFKREVEALQKCAHPNLAQLLAFDPSDEPKWFVMELLGPDLGKQAEQFRNKPLEAIRAMRPVVEAAAALHAKDYVHRDIKPKNIFRRGDSWVLGDLGIAHEYDQTRLTDDENFAGSQDWVADWVRAPEREPRPVDDVYQLVKVMYYLTTGKRERASQLRKHFARIASEAQTPFDVFFNQHLVTDDEECKSKNAGELLKGIDELLASQLPSVKGGLLASILAPQDGAWFREDVSTLVLIPVGARELHARFRHGNGQGVAYFDLRHHEQAGLPPLRSTEVRINSSSIGWSPTMKLKLSAATSGDWFMVTLPRSQVPISGFLLFYT